MLRTQLQDLAAKRSRRTGAAGYKDSTAGDIAACFIPAGFTDSGQRFFNTFPADILLYLSGLFRLAAAGLFVLILHRNASL